MKERLPFISIITVNYNGRHLLKECFDSLLAVDYPRDRLEIFMVDNYSQDNSVIYARKYYPQIKIIESGDNNYCKANNLGIVKSKGEYVAILNNDTCVDKNWLNELVRVIDKNPKVGAVGSKILLMDGRIQSAGHVQFPYYYWGDRGFFEEDKQQYNRIQEVPSVSNCSVLYRRKALKEAGLFDEDFVMYMEDVDMAFRLKQKKWKVFYVPNSVVYHKLHGSKQSTEKQKFYVERNRLLFIAKYLPEKLPEVLFGHGEIIRLKHSEFQYLLALVFNKLVKHHGIKEAVGIFARLNDTIQKIDDYEQHCRHVETEGLIINIKKELESKDKDIKTQAAELTAKLQQINDFRLKIGVLEERINNQAKELESKDAENKSLKEEVKNKDTLINELLSKIRMIEEQINTLNDIIVAKDKEIDTQNKKLLEKDLRIDSLAADITAMNERINNLENETTAKNEQLSLMNREILNIYNSETYRFIVRPFIWPFLTFVKTMVKPAYAICRKLNLPINKPSVDKAGIFISQLFAKNIDAKYMQKNEYAIKLFNNTVKEETLTLVIDIRPYKDLRHPERHYCYFTIELSIRPKSSAMLQVVYDWEKNIEAYMGSKREKIKDFWKGTLASSELYVVNAYICKNTEQKIIDKLKIMQRLIK